MTQIKVNLILLVTFIVGVSGSHYIRTDAKCVCKQWKLAMECGQDNDCEWNNNTKSCEQQLCSSIKSQSVCSSDQDCQYIDNKCGNFTKCEDLKGKTINECRLMSTNCRETNGVNCLPTVNDKTCAQLTTEGECRQGHDGFCIWAGDKCQLWNVCQQATTQPRCQESYLSCNWSDTLKQCVQLQCSEITDEFSCYGVQEGPNSHLFQTCLWNSVKSVCEETVPDSLTFDVCQEHTFSAYHWSEPDPTEGYCEQCLSTSVQRPMAQHCNCDSLSVELDCQENQSCVWNDGTCEQRKCSNIDPPQACLQVSSCAWSNNACVDFTACENYKGHSNLECNSINRKCLVSSTLETCTSKYESCSNHRTDDLCNASRSSASQQCYWNEQSNYCSDWTACSQQRQATYCDYSGACFWAGGECQKLECKHFHETTCTHYLAAPSSNTWIYCMLFDTCIPLEADLLNKDECYSSSYGSSAWSQSAYECHQCETDNSAAILVVMQLIAIFII